MSAAAPPIPTRNEKRLARAYLRVMNGFGKVPQAGEPRADEAIQRLWRITLHAHALGWVDATPFLEEKYPAPGFGR